VRTVQIFRSSLATPETAVAGMDDTGRPALVVAWIKCESCGRIDKAAHDFNYPAEMAAGMQLFVWPLCELCGRQAKLHIRRELKPAH
jgi:hypothetical protein